MKKKEKKTIFNAGLDTVGFIEAQGLPWEPRFKAAGPEAAAEFRDVVRERVARPVPGVKTPG